MLTVNKNNRLILTVIIFISITAAYPADSPEIDVNAITQSNPFAQFTQQRPNTSTAEMGQKPDLFVETATLKFLDAKSVRASILSMSSEYGHIEPDSKGNALIICDSNENVQKILAQIRKIDRKPEQIMIEVVIVDVKLDNETDIGVNWDMLTTNDHSAVFRQNYSSRLGSTLRAEDNTGNATAFNTTGTGSDLWLLWPGDIRTVIHTLQEKNNVEIIASPRVMVVSGQTASIEAVEEIPYSEQSNTSNGGELTSTKFKNVGVMLKIGAVLTDDKYILLNVETMQSVQTGSSIVTGGIGATGVPIVDTRNIKSSLLLEDSQILVIGGLRRKETQKQTNQLPLLGDIPIIGLAFKETDAIENNSELLVILSPHIYNGEKPDEVQMKKFNEITQEPLLTVPEFEEKKEKKEKEKAAKAAKEAKKAKSVKTAKK